MAEQRMSAGDRKAWEHAIASGRLTMVSPEEGERLVLLLIYTATVIDKHDGVTEADMLALLDWANDTRIASGLLDAALAGDVYIRIVPGEEPSFSLSPRGTSDAREIAERLGLPVDDEGAGS